MTATSTPTSGEVTRYLDQVRALLVDLPADEREELLDDLAVHLHEVRAETDEPLEQALGNPAAFAAELLASSGHAGAPRRRGPWRRLPGLERAQRHWGRQRTTAAERWVRALLPELVPGWWVLRGYLAAMLVSEITNDRFGSFPLPAIAGSRLLGLAATAGAIFASVQLGRRHAGRRHPFWVWGLDTVVVLGAISAFVALGPNPNEYVYVDDVHAVGSGQLTQPDGTTITNLYAYDAEGRLLDGVLVYDQDGNPVVVAPEGSTPYTDDGFAVETDYRLDINGAEVRNAYPLDQRVEEWRSGPDGSERVVDAPVRPPAITTPRLAPDGGDTGSSATTTTTSPSTTSTTSVPPTSGAEPGPEPEPTPSVPAEPAPPPAPGG